jgi:hypothetical protein
MQYADGIVKMQRNIIVDPRKATQRAYTSATMMFILLHKGTERQIYGSKENSYEYLGQVTGCITLVILHLAAVTT